MKLVFIVAATALFVVQTRVDGNHLKSGDPFRYRNIKRNIKTVPTEDGEPSKKDIDTDLTDFVKDVIAADQKVYTDIKDLLAGFAGIVNRFGRRDLDSDVSDVVQAAKQLNSDIQQGTGIIVSDAIAGSEGVIQQGQKVVQDIADDIAAGL